MGTTINKFLVSLGAALAVLATALADGTVTSTEVSQVFVALAGAILVYLVPNKVK